MTWAMTVGDRSSAGLLAMFMNDESPVYNEKRVVA